MKRPSWGKVIIIRSFFKFFLCCFRFRSRSNCENSHWSDQAVELRIPRCTGYYMYPIFGQWVTEGTEAFLLSLEQSVISQGVCVGLYILESPLCAVSVCQSMCANGHVPFNIIELPAKLLGCHCSLTEVCCYWILPVTFRTLALLRWKCSVASVTRTQDWPWRWSTRRAASNQANLIADLIKSPELVPTALCPINHLPWSECSASPRVVSGHASTWSLI